MPCEQLLLALRRALPDDVGLLDVRDVGPEFHARHSATSRVYRYHVARRPSVFLRGRAWIVTGTMHLRTLREATALVRGWHDFASFTDRQGLGDATSRCEVTHADWKEAKDQLVFRIAAGHFLPRMVRRLVGSLVRVGTGELSLQAFREWLDHPRLGAAAALTAPATGLFLEHVEYPSAAAQPTLVPGHEPAVPAASEADEAGAPPADDPAAEGAMAPAARRALEAFEQAEREGG
jgi:tRNA pseudouridine38-40 synthase